MILQHVLTEALFFTFLILGINDNGSGSAVNLELAILWAERKVVEKNRVCFAWWAAEELGLKGSTYWVSQRLASPEGKSPD
jgi:Zn-dependent M28 family amino/carboxypeptidase